jgi:hypothetical protein
LWGEYTLHVKLKIETPVTDSVNCIEEEKNMKKILILIIVVLILATMVVPAFAAPRPQPPERFHKVFDYPLVYCGDEIGVGDFWLWDHEEAYAFIVDKYDEDGNVVQRNEHVDGTDMIYREGNPDDMLNGTYHINQLRKIDPVTGDIVADTVSGHWVGIFWHINIPGHGVVFHDSSNYTFFEDRQAGLTVFDVVTLCEYFAS